MWLCIISNTQIYRQERFDTQSEAEARAAVLRNEGYQVVVRPADGS